MQDFRQLLVWEKSHRLTIDVYKATEIFPTNEKYGLTSQVRRACVSIASNIAEGAGRSSDKEFARFIEIAAGSASEVEYQLLLAHDLGFLDTSLQNDLNRRVNEVKKMLNSLRKKLRTLKPSGTHSA